MSTSRNILGLMREHEKTFSEHFTFYLNATDEFITLQGQMGLEVSAMEQLSDHDQSIIKTYVFLVESGNTTWAAALRLLSSGFVASAYGLIRVLYETAALLHYGNSSPPDTRTELHRSMFHSGFPEEEHRKTEWRFTRKATALLEKKHPDLVPVHHELNNFGGHISRARVVLSNITAVGNSSASRVFFPNWSDNRYLAGLDMLLHVGTLILEEYALMHEAYGGLTPQVHSKVKALAGTYLTTVRPKLQAMMKT